MSENHRKIIEYKFSSGVFFKQVLRFKCLECGSRLKADVTDAGRSDSCPICKAKFITPGKNNVFDDPFFNDRLCKHDNAIDDSLVIALLEDETACNSQLGTVIQAALPDDTLSSNVKSLSVTVTSNADERNQAPKNPPLPVATHSPPSSEETTTARFGHKPKLKKFLITGVDGSLGRTKILEIEAESERAAHENAKKLNVFPTNIEILAEAAEGSTQAAKTLALSSSLAPLPPIPRKPSIDLESKRDTESPCPECQKLISTRARKCPYCRSAVNENRKTDQLIRIVVVIAILLFGLSYYLKTEADKEINRAKIKKINDTGRELRGLLEPFRKLD